jgi:hypothetical protein
MKKDPSLNKNTGNAGVIYGTTMQITDQKTLDIVV